MTQAAGITRREFRIIVQDSIEGEVLKAPETKDVVSRVDETEQDEADIKAAVERNLDVGVPTFERVDSKYHVFRSGVYFHANERCFNYDKDFFKPICYSADEKDFDFIAHFNETHTILKMSINDLEKVFCACEELVRDGVNEQPKIYDVLLNLGSEAPPIEICNSVYLHWRSRARINGSIIRYLEQAPDHSDLRSLQTKATKDLIKIRKSINDVEYLKLLFEELMYLQKEGKRVEEMIIEQESKRIKDEIFVRAQERVIKSGLVGVEKMIVETPLQGQKRFEAESRTGDTALTTIPQPPSSPAFLKWCLQQEC